MPSQPDVADGDCNRHLLLLCESQNQASCFGRCSFGNFQPKHRPARKARNPRTQEVLEVPPQTVPSFTASKMFKEKVNQLAPSKVEEMEEAQ